MDLVTVAWLPAASVTVAVTVPFTFRRVFSFFTTFLDSLIVTGKAPAAAATTLRLATGFLSLSFFAILVGIATLSAIVPGSLVVVVALRPLLRSLPSLAFEIARAAIGAVVSVTGGPMITGSVIVNVSVSVVV